MSQENTTPTQPTGSQSQPPTYAPPGTSQSQQVSSVNPVGSQATGDSYSQPQHAASSYSQPPSTGSYQQPQSSTGSYQQPQSSAASYSQPQHSAASSYAYSAARPQSAAASSTTAKKASPQLKTFAFGFLGAFLACVLAFSGFGVFTLVTGNQSSVADNTKTVSLGASTSTDIQQVSENTTLAEVVADKTLHSVVSIYIYTKQSQNYGGMFGFNPRGDSGYGSDSSTGELVQSAMGSGVILSEDGYILTNYHVVEGAVEIEVSVDGEAKPLKATLVGADESSDIAVIKIEGASGLTPIEIGDSSDLSVGEWVMALGSPFGLEQSISTGIVSAVSRSYAMESNSGVTLYTNLIQTDAAINSGNSGGALVDSNGKLIGINTLISSTSGDSSGVGFAIPVDYAMGIAEALVSGKTPSHAQLGVSLSDITSSTAARYGLDSTEGAYIAEVSAGSAAEKAGIQKGDIITKFNGTAVTSTTDLMLAIRSASAGDTVDIELNRGGEALTLKATLGSDA